MLKKKVKLALFKPTPSKWAKFGNALLAISALGAGSAYVMEDEKLALIVGLCGVIGKFLLSIPGEVDE